MADDKEDTQQLTDDELKPKGKKGLSGIVIIVMSLVLIGGGVGAGLLFGKKARPATTENKTPAKVVIVAISDIYVNIAETKATRVLKVTPVLVLSDEKLVTEIEARRPIIRDLISEAACRMTIDELDGQNGRGILKREIKNKINILLRGQLAGAVQDVYFSDFLIQ
jgi:flagellar basal body-associated protein FliL